VLNHNVLKIPYLKGNAQGGAFALIGEVNLAQKGFRYNLNANLTNLRTEALINAFAPKAKNTLFGGVTGKATITGAGTRPANIKRNLKGNGQLAIKNGTLKNAELAVGLMKILGLRELKEIPIDQAQSRFTISDEIVHLKTQLGSQSMMIDQTGTIGLDEKLDLGIVAKVSAKLAPKMVSQSAMAGFITDDQGWTGVPLRVGGTISKPSYGIDTQAVGRKLGEGLQKKAGEALRKILQPDQDQSSKTQKEKSTDTVERLRGLFGR
jgi:AsmA protein